MSSKEESKLIAILSGCAIAFGLWQGGILGVVFGVLLGLILASLVLKKEV